ncbi:radical SAM protein [Candidatus Thorarchaeota archaeon]|nr:MAG: radical SAM protein [Candidatus Thorarchaeota archaeon]
MRRIHNMDTEEILQLKIRLLTEGATIPEGEWTGRKGGAGPVGGRYFILPNGRPCGVPVRTGEMANKYESASLLPHDRSDVWIYDGRVELRAVPRPKFYSLETEEGVPYHKIALLHGDGTLATTVYQACRYWSHGTQCKFCTVPMSFHSGDSILEKAPGQIAEVVEAAEKEGVARNVLLTTGTPETPDMGAERLVRIVEAIREISKIPVGVQFEPPAEESTIKRVADAGANAVGIHIESADEAIREEMCPGKHQYGPLDLYKRSWQYALDHFGRGNVSTFILHGLGESIKKTLMITEELAEVGVLPVVAPVRPAPGSQLADYIPTYVGNLERSMEFYKEVGKILLKHDLDPSKTVAGCHKCGGCTPGQEAYDWAASQ